MNFKPRTAALFSAAVSLLFASAATGQTLMTTSPYTDISSSLDISNYMLGYYTTAPAAQGSNSSSIMQTGNFNRANATMTAASGGSYYGNVTAQTQVGNSNSSTINAIGNSNPLLATQQTGNDNISSVNAYGNSNMLMATQTGNSNSASITAYGSNNSYSTSQTGNGLSVNLTQVGNGKSISITQTR